jgi:lipoprotein-anchoring transpeptidase ErfK/SrfK
MHMRLQERRISCQERRVTAPRVKIATLTTMTGAVLAAGTALALTPGTAAQRETTLAVQSLASNGTAARPTPDGTFPVYPRDRSQVMRGLMADGSGYADPVQFVSYFHGDYAVHSMERLSFGWPQTLGCVELPLNEARLVWPFLTYGSLVTVTG